MTAAEASVSSEERHRSGNLRGSAAGLLLVFASLSYLFARAQLLFLGSSRKMAVTAVAIALGLAPLPLIAAHHPSAGVTAESVMHAALLERDVAEHGHGHDHGEAHEPAGGHIHGHDPADHSHQFAFFSGSTSHRGLPPPRGWPSLMSVMPDPATGLGIDRPPKLTLPA
jgi:hypothetical protein